MFILKDVSLKAASSGAGGVGGGAVITRASRKPTDWSGCVAPPHAAPDWLHVHQPGSEAHSRESVSPPAPAKCAKSQNLCSPHRTSGSRRKELWVKAQL